MTGSRLERRYRRWLLAYPVEYRRERGDELIATLLDLAEPGRVRPGPLDVVDLVRVGLGQRLRGLLRELSVAPGRRGSGQIMAYVAFGSACVIALTELMLTLMPDGDGWRVAIMQIPTSVVVLPLLTRLGITAPSRGRRLVVAVLLTGFTVLALPEGSAYQPIAFAEWLAVLWFRRQALEVLHQQEGAAGDRLAT